MKKGFTLVELSIVLVVIGLLVGGILVGKNLIESSGINATVHQLGQFDAGVIKFVTMYKQIPGDSKSFGGDGDGAIESHNFGTDWDGQMTAHACEVSNFWTHVFSGKFKAGTYTSGSQQVPDIVKVSGADKSSPAAKVGRNNSAWIASTYSDGVGVPNWWHRSKTKHNYYSIITGNGYIQGGSGGSYRFPRSNMPDSKALTPAQLYSIDKKADDGRANSGYITSGGYHDFALGYAVPTLVPNANCSTNESYEIQNTDYECTPFFRIGGTMGLPQ